MAADLTLAVAKPGDNVETPTGRLGKVMAVLQDHRREVQYLDVEGGSVILPAGLLRVLLPSKPKPWPSRIP